MPAQISLVVDRLPPAAAIARARPWLKDSPSARDFVSRGSAPLSHYEPDQEIFGEGDRAEAVYKIVSGVVRTCRFLSDGRRQIEAFLLPGDLMGLEAGAVWTLSAEAVTDCTVAVYRRRQGESFSLEDESLTPQLLSYAMRSLARARSHMFLLGRRSALEKVATFLVNWSDRAQNGQSCTLPMTRQDIADYLGLTIETVSRTLSQLERDKLIELPSAREIRLKDREALREFNI